MFQIWFYLQIWRDCSSAHSVLTPILLTEMPVQFNSACKILPISPYSAWSICEETESLCHLATRGFVLRTSGYTATALCLESSAGQHISHHGGEETWSHSTAMQFADRRQSSLVRAYHRIYRELSERKAAWENHQVFWVKGAWRRNAMYSPD